MKGDEMQLATQMSPAQPPTQKPKLTMDFFDALRQVLDGRQITKLEWKDSEIRVLMAEQNIGNAFHLMLCIRRPNGQDISGEKIFSTAKLWVSDGDMLGTDWIVVE